MSLVESLEAMLTEAGYHTLLVRLNPHNPAMDVIRERKLDAVFVLDVMDEMFYRISANFVEGVPLILIDSIIDDRLFNQVNYNYPQALQAAVSSSAAPSCLVMESYYNKALSEWVIAESALPQEHIHIVNNSQEAQSELMSFWPLTGISTSSSSMNFWQKLLKKLPWPLLLQRFAPAGTGNPAGQHDNHTVSER